MTSRPADKIAFLAIAAIVLAISAPACNDGRSAHRNNLNNSSSLSDQRVASSDNRSGSERIDFGEDWDAAAQAREGGGAPRRSIRSLNRTAQDDRSSRPSGDAEAADEPYWTIVLGTFSGTNHEQAAHTMVSELPRVAPELARNARPHTTSRGSMVIYGRFPSADDPQARQELEQVKTIRYREMPVFARAFLSRITPAASSSSNPHALMSVRRIYPAVDPLYTLQVAAWSDFDSGLMTMDQIRRHAEEHVRRLRAQGHEAYFHHDAGQMLSVVTVGLFDRTAFDAETGERSPELRMLMRQFPAHLVNGEELHEPIDVRRPDRGTRVQQPHLVLVPLP